jgi:predicted MPP superfamily phosphohydrolase
MRLRDLAWMAAGAAGAAGGAILVHRLITERWRLTFSRATFGIRNLAPELDGLRVAHLTDFHLGYLTPPSFLARAVEMVRAESPDLVALTGDYLDVDDVVVDECAEALKGLEAPRGAYAVLGNHDYDVGADIVTDCLARAGVVVLKNEAVSFGDGDRQLWMVGLDDTASHREDSRAACEGIPAGDPVIILSHTPDVLPRAAEMGAELVLAGHTHGGQVRLPWVGAPHAPIRLSVKYAYGTAREGHTRVHTSRGLGLTQIPVRLNCPPEIGLFTLRAVVR